MQEVILVKLGEIVLKGLNRRTFEDRLLKNIRRRIARAGNFEVYSMQSTIYIEPKDEDADIDEAEERISKIFGVIGYARACVCEKDMDAITKMAPEYLGYSHQRRPRQPGGGVDDGKARRGADGHSLCEPAVHERART